MSSTFILSAANDGAATSASAARAIKRDMMAPGGRRAIRKGTQRFAKAARQKPTRCNVWAQNDSLHRHDPHVAIHHRVAVVLELEGAGAGFFLLAAGTLLGELDVVVNLHAVVVNRRVAVL